jgi:hypothetical protein
MDRELNEGYYAARTMELLSGLDEDAARWKPLLAGQHGDDFADKVIRESREEYKALIPRIPYIGGEESFTGALLESVRCLAFYRAMKKHGRTAAETGKLLYDAILARADELSAPILLSQRLIPEQLMARRRSRAARSQERRYPEDYVYQFVAGDGEEFDYGYDFTECAAQKFYRAQGAEEFLPFYCFLDFAYSKVSGLGLTRTMTLAEGHAKCNHRFRRHSGL